MSIFDQGDPANHEYCTLSDGKWWFDNGEACKHLDLHEAC